jgi:hypothetical protein
MERIPKRKLRGSQGDMRLGPKNGRGRTQGAKNKRTSAFAVAFMLAAQQVGEDGRGRNGIVGYLSRIARTEPKLFFRLYMHVAMDQNWSGEEEFEEDVRYETVEEVKEALRKRGIPMSLWENLDERPQASEKDEALEEVRRPVPRYSQTRRP